MDQPSMLNPVWDLKSGGLVSDVSTDDFQWTEVKEARENLSSATSYELSIRDRDQFYLPSHAFLEVEVEIKVGGSANVEANQIGLAGDAWSVFENVKLKFNNSEFANLDRPGKACHMRKVMEMSRDYAESCGSIQGYYPDQISDGYVGVLGATASAPNVATVAVANNATDVPSGMFEPINYDLDASSKVIAVRKNETYNDAFRKRIKRSVGKQRYWLPLQEVFPILAQQGVTKGLNISLDLYKVNSANTACFGKYNAGAVTIDISRVSMWLPKLTPSVETRGEITKQLMSEHKSLFKYQHMHLYQSNSFTPSTTEGRYRVTTEQNRPTTVLLGFQLVQRDETHRLNSLEFDIQKIKQVHVRLNGSAFPSEYFDVEASNLKYARVVQACHQAGKKTFDNENGSLITYENFKNGPNAIFAFDLEHYSRALLENATMADLEIRWTCDTQPTDYKVVVCVLSERDAEKQLTQGDIRIAKA